MLCVTHARVFCSALFEVFFKCRFADSSVDFLMSLGHCFCKTLLDHERVLTREALWGLFSMDSLGL